ncbi:unnamed protein product [Durusdinium trenchii]|uniref:Uncharacterized protein n=1 Tax=Durusdinium trenchii TaxID=1381693 RepID=A0ABP0PI80_9DINO
MRNMRRPLLGLWFLALPLAYVPSWWAKGWPRGRAGSQAEAELLSQLAVLLMPQTDIGELLCHQRALGGPKALLMQHRAFAAEVERAWERSHSNDLERRKAPHREVPSSHAPAPGVRAVGETAEGSKKRKKKKRAESEETFIVDDELEAEVVEDLEDFLEHSRLRQTLKKTADELRVSQQRKDKKASGALEADAKKAPEPKVPPAKAKKDEEHAPKMGGGKGNGRRKSGEEKSHTKEKEVRKSGSYNGTNGAKQSWEEQQWYGDNSWSSQQDSWDDWGNSRWWGQRGNGQAGGWNGRRERRRPAGRGTSGWS